MDIVFYFFLTLLFLTVIFYFMLDIQVSRLNHKIEKLKTEIEKFGTPEQKELERKVFGYEAKIKEVKKLVESHKIPSNFFKFIEENTLPIVYFSNMALDTTKGELSLSLQTENFKSLSLQLSVFEKNPNVKEISVFNTTINNEGKVEADLKLSLSPELFLWK
jgi:hypothetical protein